MSDKRDKGPQTRQRSSQIVLKLSAPDGYYIVICECARQRQLKGSRAQDPRAPILKCRLCELCQAIILGNHSSFFSVGYIVLSDAVHVREIAVGRP